MNTKTTFYLFLIFLILSLAWAENYRRTAADLYEESYMFQMKKQMGFSGTNDLRADQYRAAYENFDSHHNSLRNGSTAARTADAQQAKPFVHVPA